MESSRNQEEDSRQMSNLNAEAALRCLTEASKRFCAKERKRANKRDSSTISSDCNDDDSKHIRLDPEQRYDSSQSDSGAARINNEHNYFGEHCETNDPLASYRVSAANFVRRMANLNATACMTALLSPTKKKSVVKPPVSESTIIESKDSEEATEDTDIDVCTLDSSNATNESLQLYSEPLPRVTLQEIVTKVPAGNSSSNNAKKPSLPLAVPAESDSVIDLVEKGFKAVNSKSQGKVSKSFKKINNGWTWIGDPVETASIKKGKSRKYYIGIRKRRRAIFVRDATTFWSGSKKDDIPYVGKILSFWQERSEMMCSVYWYYQPENEDNYVENELLASQHMDHTPVASIIEKCYVLGNNAFCRYRAALKHKEECSAVSVKASDRVVPSVKAQSCYWQLQIPNKKTDARLVYLCRKSYNYKSKKVSGK